MRPISALLAAALGLLLLATPAAAGGWTLTDYVAKGRTHDWAGFGVGTMIHVRTTREMTVQGRAKPQRLVEEERKTLLRITDTEYVFRVDTRQDGRWTTSTLREPRVTGLAAVISEAGRGVLTVEGRTYACRKRKVLWMRDGTLTQEAVVWESADRGILRMAWTGDVDGETITKRLDAQRKIGEVTVRGREQSIETHAAGAPTMKGTSWVSLEVPERMVRMEMTGSKGDVSFRVLQEVVAFVRE